MFTGEKDYMKVVNLLKIAHKYDIVPLVQACHDHLVANTVDDNVFELWKLADEYSLDELKYEILQVACCFDENSNAEYATNVCSILGADFVLFSKHAHPLQKNDSKKRKRPRPTFYHL